MENIDIEYLEQFKSDLISEIRKLNKRIDDIAEQQRTQEKNNREFNEGYVEDLKSAIIKSASKSVSSTSKTVVSEGDGVGISDYDIKRILKIFSDGLNALRDELIQVNKDVMTETAKDSADYIKSFNRRFDELLERNSDHMTEKLAEHDVKFHDLLTTHYNGAIERIQQNHQSFSEQLKIYSDDLAIRNAEALENVQKENNQELMSISQSLDQQIKTHDTFIRNCNDFNTELKDGISCIIGQNKEIVAAFGEAAAKNNADTAMLWEQYLNEMSQKIDALEQKNAAYFHAAMDDYRERFIAANAEAMRSVQAEMLEKISETQTQLENLAKTTNNIGGMVLDLCDNLEQFIEKEEKLSENRYANLKKLFDSKLETNNRYTENIRNSISEMTETVKETTTLVAQSSENYNKAISTIRENQDRLKSLSHEDIALLKGLLK